MKFEVVVMKRTSHQRRNQKMHFYPVNVLI